MKESTLQKHRFLEKVLRLYADGVGPTKIARIIPVPKETIRGWLIKFAPDYKPRYVKMNSKSRILAKRSLSFDERYLRSLKAEIKRLRSELERCSLRAEAYEELIRIAESDFHISILKKDGAKQ